MRNRQQEGIALITTLLILLLLSTMIVGLAWLVMGDQRLGGNNNDRQLAFYAAEAGMETLTASLENLFDANYAPNQTAINLLMTTPGPPSNIQGVQYLAPGSTVNGSGYLITFTPSAANASLPASSYGTIPTGAYAGLVGLMTPYTLAVTAHTAEGSEVKLQRQVQTVGIPVFQFGFFSQTDLSFFAGPNFNFGGRVHTNGNLWLAEGSGSTLTLSQKVTAVGEIVSSNLENGYPTVSAYPGAVNITTGSSVQNLLSQSPEQSVTGTNNSVATMSPYNTNFGPMSNSIYNGNIAVGSPNGPVTALNLAIATPAIGGQSIDLIRRPVYGENGTNSAKLGERYWSQVSFRVLLSDYGSDGKCDTADISSSSSTALPDLSPNLGSPVTPIDLATLAWTATGPPTADGNTILPYAAPPSWLTGAKNVPATAFPLPTSDAEDSTGKNYNTNDGYWVKQYYPVITGCIKIDYQTTAGGAWVDVTPTILNLGYTGRDINPQPGSGKSTTYIAPPLQPNQPTSQVGASGPTVATGLSPTPITCTDPSPLAIIRLARVRDNPSWANSGGGCPAPPATAAAQLGTDYWPTVLFDTREGLLRDSDLATNSNSPNGALAIAGAMYYVELDVANLNTWLSTNSALVNKPEGFSVYFSDRRGDVPDPTPPPSVGTATMLTGAFGYDDFVNSVNGTSAANGCPNGTLDQGEDVEGDYNSSGVDTTPVFRTFGNTLSPTPASLWPIALAGTQLGTPTTLLPQVLANNPGCAGPGIKFPYATAVDPRDLRENPPLLFRRALKVVDGSTITLGTCNSVPCGLTIVAENPVYLQGDYNNPGLSTTFANAGVGAAIISDALTLLSDNWNDVNSFSFPYLDSQNGRVAHDTTYRVAIAAGKGIAFLNPAGTYQDFGTDGGAHNFLRFMEDWGGSQPNGTLYYQGSIVSMFYNHQAVGSYKCCTTVYAPPGRAYQFDTNFLTPSLLPPLTPMLRTVNTIGFTQMILPTQ